MMLLVWIPHCKGLCSQAKTEETEERINQWRWRENLSITFFIFPGEFFFGFKEMWLMQVAFVLVRQVWNKKSITIAFLLLPQPCNLKRCGERKNCNLFDDRYTHDEDILHELQNIVVDRSSVSSLHKEHDCLQRTELEIYF